MNNKCDFLEMCKEYRKALAIVDELIRKYRNSNDIVMIATLNEQRLDLLRVINEMEHYYDEK